MRPGDRLTETLFLPNPDGSGHPGATWTVIDSHDPLGNPFTPTVADLGGGSYLVSYQTAAGDPAGLYYALIQADDPFTQEYEIEWTLDYGVAAAGYPTLAEVRQIIATDLADYRALTATGGSTTTFTDPLELLEYEDTYVGADLVFTGGTSANIAKRCRVTASTMATQTITFVPALGQPVAPGDTADLYNIGGRGFRLPDYNREIRDAIREVQRANLISQQSAPIPFDAGTPVITLPDGWLGLYAVTATTDEPDGDDWRVQAARYEGTPGWFLRSDGVVVIGGDARWWLDGLTVILSGYIQHPDVQSDSDPIFINTEWLRLRVKANLLERKRDRDAAQWSVEFANRANSLRPLLTTPFEPNTRLLPR